MEGGERGDSGNGAAMVEIFKALVFDLPKKTFKNKFLRPQAFKRELTN